jgi:hypothetical protein
MSTEKERETQVYMAKLAEQAERYEGSLLIFLFLPFILFACLGMLVWICLFKASELRFVFRLVIKLFLYLCSLIFFFLIFVYVCECEDV